MLNISNILLGLNTFKIITLRVEAIYNVTLKELCFFYFKVSDIDPFVPIILT